MTQEEINKLVELVGLVKRDALYPPNMPFEIWRSIHSVMTLPTIEVLVTRDGRDFLLVMRKDEYWDGWHIPGGFLLFKETLPQACTRIAKKELGVEVSFDQVVTAFVWPDHPYGGTISIVCKCTTTGTPTAGKFFTSIPSPMIPYHDKFVEEFLKTS